MQPNDWRREIYRASRLDTFKEYQSGERFDGSDYTTAEFIERMTVRSESPAMAAGTAVHKVIEDAGFGELPERAACNGWHILFDLDATLPMPAAREVHLQRGYRGITLFGRVDAMDANTIHDTKTTSNIDIDRYLDSFQWRAYCWMSGRQRFIYDILKVKLDEEAKVVTVQDYIALPVNAYPAMGREVERLLVEFDSCVRALRIPEIMQDRKAA